MLDIGPFLELEPARAVLEEFGVESRAHDDVFEAALHEKLNDQSLELELRFNFGQFHFRFVGNPLGFGLAASSAFAQGAVAGIATKLWFEAGRVLLIVPAPLIADFEERMA